MMPQAQAWPPARMRRGPHGWPLLHAGGGPGSARPGSITTLHEDSYLAGCAGGSGAAAAFPTISGIDFFGTGGLSASILDSVFALAGEIPVLNISIGDGADGTATSPNGGNAGLFACSVMAAVGARASGASSGKHVDGSGNGDQPTSIVAMAKVIGCLCSGGAYADHGSGIPTDMGERPWPHESIRPRTGYPFATT
jgi:hypothetical protein